jgi:hypothetical protein
MKRLMVTYFGVLLAFVGWYPGGTPVDAQVRPLESRQEACIHAAQLTRQIATEREAGVTRDAAVKQIAQTNPDLSRSGIRQVVSGIFADLRSPVDIESDFLTKCLADAKPVAGR